MITADKIVFDERKDKVTGDVHMRARVEVSRVVNVSKYEAEPGRPGRRIAKEMLMHAMWREIYGDLSDELAKLETAFLRDAKDPFHAGQLVDSVRAKMAMFESESATSPHTG